MSGWMTAWVVYTVFITCAAMYWYAERRDDRHLIDYYREKWLAEQSRRRA